MANGHWTFLSNHSHVLVCIARNPDVRVRDIAERVGITERAVQRIIAELEEAGFVSHRRIGRRNRYTIDPDKELRHELEAGVSIRLLLANLVSPQQLQRAISNASDSDPQNPDAAIESYENY